MLKCIFPQENKNKSSVRDVCETCTLWSAAGASLALATVFLLPTELHDPSGAPELCLLLRGLMFTPSQHSPTPAASCSLLVSCDCCPPLLPYCPHGGGGFLLALQHHYLLPCHPATLTPAELTASPQGHSCHPAHESLWPPGPMSALVQTISCSPHMNPQY